MAWNAKDNSKLVRNQGKFENAMHNYETAQKTLDTLCSDILDKADQIQVNLNIKFTKNTQLAHYAQMEKVYEEMDDLEQRMNDVHLQVMDRKWQEEREANKMSDMERAAGGRVTAADRNLLGNVVPPSQRIADQQYNETGRGYQQYGTGSQGQGYANRGDFEGF